jgi:hypothetical protein
MVEFMQQGATVTLKCSAKHLKKTAYGHSEIKAWNADIWFSAPL